VTPGGEICVISPLSGEEITRIRATPPEELGTLSEKARRSQERWAKRPIQKRAEILRRLIREFGDQAEEIVRRLHLEIGRDPAESWFSEILPNLDLIEYWCKKGLRYLLPERVPLNPINFPGKKAWIYRIPRGVVGLITPWNYPVSIPLRTLIPALLAGNAVLWKPSEYSAWVSQLLYEIFARYLPEDLIILVQGGPRVGARLVEEVDAIGFTGSLMVGREISQRAGARMIPASLELGGKDLAVVFQDADLKRTSAGIAWGALTNAGQNCSAIEILCLEEPIKHPFLTHLREEVQRMARFVGPLIHEGQLEKVLGQIEEAMGMGALALEGGAPEPNSLRLPPTLLDRIPLQSALIREETFGPVLPIVTFRDLREVEALLESSKYGLTLSLWTRNIERALRFSLSKPVGVITINNHAFTAAIPSLPWSGVKGSGLGVTNSPYALEWLTHPQAVLVDRSQMRELWWHPYTPSALDLARGMTALRSGRFSLTSLWRTIKGFLRRWKEEKTPSPGTGEKN
jgi:acyl-CoA reductase-like NAD-dependent aldehyde dehydrogenase